MEPSSSPAPQDTDFAERLEQLLAEVRKNSSLVRTDVRREAQRVIFENDAREYLYNRLSPPVHIGPRGTWACNFQVLAYLVDEILRPALTEPVIVELGSGVSTAWFGLSLQQKGEGRVYSLEHDAFYARHTQSILEHVGVTENAHVIFAPLVDVKPHIGELTNNGQWYDQEELMSTVSRIDVLFVDGPPSTFGPGVRAAAYPVLSSRLADGALVVLDDVHRSDEQQVVEMWKQYARNSGAELTEIATVGESAVLRNNVSVEDQRHKEQGRGCTP